MQKLMLQATATVGFADFFFLWCYGICIVFWLYCSIQHPTHLPMTPLWREEECGKVVTNKFNGAIFAFVRFGEKERQVNKPECKL